MREKSLKAQFHECLDDVKSLLEQGYFKVEIWEKMRDEGRYKGDYSYFTRRLNSALDGEKIPAKKTHKIIDDDDKFILDDPFNKK